jgi:hypothetical protein
MDTPLPAEVPHAQNPPEGAILYYYLGAKPAGDIKLEIFDAQNKLVRTISSRPAPPLDEAAPPVPDYWLRKPLTMDTNIGTNRINWDLYYDNPPAISHNWGQVMPAIDHDTPYTPQGAFALPGTYTVKLTVGGKSVSQPVVVHEDPRIGESTAAMAGMRAQFDLEQKNSEGLEISNAGYRQTVQLRAQLKALASASPDVAKAAAALDAKVAPIQGLLSAAVSGPYGVSAYSGNPGFTGVNGSFAGLMVIVDYMSDHAPVDAQVKAFHDYCTDMNNNLVLWRTLNEADLKTLNDLLRQNKLQPLGQATAPHDQACGAIPAGFEQPK